MKFHTLSGLPRSGSTLLQNLLQQNPRFHCSSTSPIGPLIAETSLYYSSQDEVKGLLAGDRERTEGRIADSMRGMIEGWYAEESKTAEVIFDKGRAWPHNAQLLAALYPDAKIITMVRDLRSVFASIEKGHQATPLFSLAKTPSEKTVVARYEQFFAPTGMVGLCLDGIEDALRRTVRHAEYVQCEALCSNPEFTLKRIYAAIEEEWFDGHDYTDVQNTAKEIDAIWLNKFPHQGCGKVTPQDPEGWKEHCPADVAANIMQRFAGFNAAFGYA